MNRFRKLVIIFLDSISETNPRVIDENRARKLANDLKRCNYFETCATYGLNVERVFRDGKNCSGKKIFNDVKVFVVFKATAFIDATTNLTRRRTRFCRLIVHFQILTILRRRRT